MSYTYDDFVSAADAAGLKNKFSAQDLQTAKRNPEFGISLLSLMKDNAGAKTTEQQLLATEAANQLRKNYGIYHTGTPGVDSAYAGSYGSRINDLMGQIHDYGSFDYDSQEAYQKLLDSVAKQQPFQYDLEKDPSWGSYKKAYLREGDRAGANALAQASAASGGRPSSFALQAAQQAQNYYAGQLSDMVPTLEQNAYSRYLSDFNNKLNGLNALSTDRAFDYNQWMDRYNMLQNSLGNLQGQDDRDYQRYLDALSLAYQQARGGGGSGGSGQGSPATGQQGSGGNPVLANIMGSAAVGLHKFLGQGNGSGDQFGGIQSGVTEDAVIDQRSVLALGYGPIGAEALSKLVASGEVIEYVEDGRIKFRRRTEDSNVPGPITFPGTPQSSGKQKTGGGRSPGVTIPQHYVALA